MDFKYPLKYRTFDQLFEDVTIDLKNKESDRVKAMQKILTRIGVFSKFKNEQCL